MVLPDGKPKVARHGLRLFAGDVVVNDLFVRSSETDALQIVGGCAGRVWACLSQPRIGAPLPFRRNRI